MATNMEDMNKSLEDLDKEITCTLCLEHYEDPKVLPCLHYYCKKCILKMALKKNPVSCPECRKESKLALGKEDELPSAHFINRLQELVAKQRKALSKEIVCEICTERPVKPVAFCKQCKKFICEECVKSHSRMKALFDGHHVIPASEISKLNAKDLVHNPTKKCLAHDKQRKIYCYQCKQLICRDCTVTAHKDHHFEFTKVAAANNRDKLTKNVQLLKETDAMLQSAIQDVKLTANEVGALEKKLERNIEESFEELQQMLLKRKAELVNDLRAGVQRKTDNLKAQEESLCTASEEVQNITDYTRRCIKYGSDDDITATFAEMETKIKSKLLDPKDNAKSLKPLEELDIGTNINCAAKLQEICKEHAQITRVPFSIIAHDHNLQGNLGHPSSVRISVLLVNGHSLKYDPTVQSCLRSIRVCKSRFGSFGKKSKFTNTPNTVTNHKISTSSLGQNSIYVNTENIVIKHSPGKYVITYTPTSCGQQELVITATTSDGYREELIIPFTVEQYNYATTTIPPFKKQRFI